MDGAAGCDRRVRRCVRRFAGARVEDPHLRWPRALLIAGTFGLFQAVMPIIGRLLGSAFSSGDPGLRSLGGVRLARPVGGQMLSEALFSPNPDETGETDEGIGPHDLVMLGVAPSIDALAVGLSLSLPDVNIWLTAAVIGVITFGLSMAAVFLGHRVGVWCSVRPRSSAGSSASASASTS